MYLGNGTPKNIFSLLKAKETGLLNAKETRISDELIYQTTAKELRKRKETLKFIRGMKETRISRHSKSRGNVINLQWQKRLVHWTTGDSLQSRTTINLQRQKRLGSNLKSQMIMPQWRRSRRSINAGSLRSLRIKRPISDNLENLNYVVIARGKEN